VSCDRVSEHDCRIENLPSPGHTVTATVPMNVVKGTRELEDVGASCGIRSLSNVLND
jgi:hypothetical protein